jgi:hypothetical protein
VIPGVTCGPEIAALLPGRTAVIGGARLPGAGRLGAAPRCPEQPASGGRG